MQRYRDKDKERRSKRGGTDGQLGMTQDITTK